MMKIGEIEGELLERYVTSERKEPNLQQKLMNVRQKMENHGPYGILRIYTAWKKHPDFGCEGRCTHYTVDSEHYMTIRYENRPTNAKNPDFVTAAKSIKRRWYQLNCVSSGCGAFPLLHCANELGMYMRNEFVQAFVVTGIALNESAIILEPGRTTKLEAYHGDSEATWTFPTNDDPENESSANRITFYP
ncbi:unnamed protein product, partial [Mesorhabditis spiculigera]